MAAVLWTDVVDPAELSGYAREALADYEESRGTLARVLPNRVVPDIQIKFRRGDSGLVDISDFRAYDARPTVGAPPEGRSVIIELPALGREFPISEYNQLRGRSNASDETVRTMIESTAERAARSAADAIEWLRGIVLWTGKATVPGFMDDDFARSGTHDVLAGTLWSDPTADALGMIQSWTDIYKASNGGQEPGAFIVSTRIVRAMAKLNQFKSLLVNGTSRPATQAMLNSTMEDESLPPLVVYDRQVSKNKTMLRVSPDHELLMVPPLVDPSRPEDTQLGATTWGQTLSSTEADWNIPDADQPGLVVGAYREPKPPMIAEVISDAIALPHLANANLTLNAQVLAPA